MDAIFGSLELIVSQDRGGRVCTIGRHSQWNGLLKSRERGQIIVFFFSSAAFSPWTTDNLAYLSSYRDNRGLVPISFPRATIYSTPIAHPHLVSLLNPCHLIILANPVLACD